MSPKGKLDEEIPESVAQFQEQLRECQASNTYDNGLSHEAAALLLMKYPD